MRYSFVSTKGVGTQYNLAQRYPEFKWVYDAVQYSLVLRAQFAGLVEDADRVLVR